MKLGFWSDDQLRRTAHSCCIYCIVLWFSDADFGGEMDKGGREGLGLGRMLSSKCFLFVMRQAIFSCVDNFFLSIDQPGGLWLLGLKQ